MKSDKVSFVEGSFLAHIVDEVFHEVSRAKSMEDIVARNNIAIEDTRPFETVVDIALSQAQYTGELADAVCYEFEGIFIHDVDYMLQS